jgi:hypothetical protein
VWLPAASCGPDSHRYAGISVAFVLSLAMGIRSDHA